MIKKSIIVLLAIYFCFSVYAETNDAEYKCLEEAWKYYNEGIRRLQQGFSDKGVVSLKHALEIDPKCMYTYAALGSYYTDTKQYDESIKLSTKAIENIPQYAWTFYNAIAGAYFAKGEYEKAINTCEEALKKFPNIPHTYHTLGRIYYKLGDYGKAKENLNKALELADQKKDKMLIQETEMILKMISQ